MDIATAAAFVTIVVLVIVNAWIVTRLEVRVRPDEDDPAA